MVKSINTGVVSKSEIVAQNTEEMSNMAPTEIQVDKSNGIEHLEICTESSASWDQPICHAKKHGWIHACTHNSVSGSNKINLNSEKGFCAMGVDMAPGNYYTKLVEKLGAPSYCIPEIKSNNNPQPAQCTWTGDAVKTTTGADSITIRNELIAHQSPMPHVDFLYSTSKIPGLTAHRASKLAHASGSIMVDRLKNEVTARCGMNIKNQVTLSFAQDVAEGKHDDKDVCQVKKAYEYSIMNNVHHDNYIDFMGEKK